MKGFEVLPQKLGTAPSGPTGGGTAAARLVEGGFQGNDEHLTYALFENFFESLGLE